MKAIHMVTWVLLIIGGLNWGLEAFHYGIGNYIPWTAAMLIYILIGLSALVDLFTHKKCCSVCGTKSDDMKSGSAPMAGM